MFKRVKTATLIFILLATGSSMLFAQTAGTSKFKCLIQMSSYMGEGAYVVISTIDSKGAYDKTLYVLGPDKQWYKTILEWHKFNTKKKTNISAITGASVTGGDRSVNVIEIDNSKINAGYSLRFESAVEDKEYYVNDLEIPLTTATLEGKHDGTGYIRYVRFSPN